MFVFNASSVVVLLTIYVLTNIYLFAAISEELCFSAPGEGVRVPDKGAFGTLTSNPRTSEYLMERGTGSPSGSVASSSVFSRANSGANSNPRYAEL